MASDGTFPEADVQTELLSGQNKDFEIDPVSSDIAAIKEEKEDAMKKETEAARKLKTAIVVSAVIVAVAGTAFTVTKKLREK